MKAYQADIAKFEATDTQVLGISVDSSPANARFAQDTGVTFPLLSDFVRRQVVKDYGIFLEQYGVGTRATFVIDKEGIIRHVEQGNTAIDPSGALQTCSIFDKPKKTEQ
jgi:mycoredoxin-dependent peroxiredoxin